MHLAMRMAGHENDSVREISRKTSAFAKTKVVMWANFEDAPVYMLYELAAAHFWPYQEFRPNVQALFSDDARFNSDLFQEMIVSNLLDHRSSFRSIQADVFLVVASSKYATRDDAFLASLKDKWTTVEPFTLESFMHRLYVDSSGDAEERKAVAEAISVRWHGKSLNKDYNFWIRPVNLIDHSWWDVGSQGFSSREGTVMEKSDEAKMVEKYRKSWKFWQLRKYAVPSITVGPSKFAYKIGLVGGNGPIAGAFAVLMAAKKLLQAGKGLGHVGLELFSQSQHPMSATEAAQYPVMLSTYVKSLSKFLTRKDIDIFGCASNTWHQNIYSPTAGSWGMAVQSGFRMVHMPRATVRKATQCLKRSRLGMIATHWTHRSGLQGGEVDADGFLINGTGILERGDDIKNVYAMEVQQISHGSAVIISANVDTAWDAIMVAKHGDIETAKKMFLDEKPEKIEGLGVPEHFGSSNQGVWAGSRVVGNVRYIQQQKVDAVIGGCTEVGLALTQQDLDSISEPGSMAFVDSGAVLAEVLAKKALARGKAIELCD